MVLPYRTFKSSFARKRFTHKYGGAAPTAQNGFTLIEVLIAISIGAMVLILISSVTMAVVKNRDIIKEHSLLPGWSDMNDGNITETSNSYTLTNAVDFLDIFDKAMLAASIRRMPESAERSSAHPIMIEHTREHVTIKWVAATGSALLAGPDLIEHLHGKASPSALEGWKLTLPRAGNSGTGQLSKKSLVESLDSAWTPIATIEDVAGSVRVLPTTTFESGEAANTTGSNWIQSENHDPSRGIRAIELTLMLDDGLNSFRKVVIPPMSVGANNAKNKAVTE